VNDIDRFFDEALRQTKLDSRAFFRGAARELEADIRRQIRRNFSSPSIAFMRGVRVHDYEDGSYVRLSLALSNHAERQEIKGNPNLWILLPEGARLGLKRMGAGFDWNALKRRYGNNLSFAPVSDGDVVLFRSPRGVVPIYKIQKNVATKQKIEFYEKAEKVITNY
jgi:hypothetical protein